MTIIDRRGIVVDGHDPAGSSATVVELVFATLALAAAAEIGSDIDIVETLGYASAGDGGGARYYRITTTTAANWRFTSADGQMWSLVNDGKGLPWEAFGLVDGADNTSAFDSMETWINLTGAGLGGATLNAKPGADYKIWPAGTTPARILALIGVSGITFNFNGARISTNNLFAPQGLPIIFGFQNSSRIVFNNPKYIQTAYTTLDSAKGAFFIALEDQAAPYSNGIIINNLEQTGGIYGLVVTPGLRAAKTTNNIRLNNGKFDSVYYPLSFQNGGDDFKGNISCTNCGRPYFPYGVSNHEVSIISDGGGLFNDVLLKVYAAPSAIPERNTLSNIDLKYRNIGRVNNTASQSLAALAFQQTVAHVTVSGAASHGGLIQLTVNSTSDMATGQAWYAGSVGGIAAATGKWIVTIIDSTHIDLQGSTFSGVYTSGGYLCVPATIKNVKVLLDVNNDSNQQPAAFLTYKHLSSGAADSTAAGYTVENVTLSGTLKNYNYGVAALDLFGAAGTLYTSAGTWTGDTITNFCVRDLTIEGTNTTTLLNATDVTSAVLDNVKCTASTVVWTVTDPNNIVYTNSVSGSGLTNRRTIAPSVAVSTQFVTGTAADGSQTRAQPAFTDISGTITVAQGGTAIVSYAIGDLIYASGAATLSKLSDIATGNVLKSGGVGVAPAWGKVTSSEITAAAVTKTDDTNVTMTLGGAPTTGAVNAFSMTLGWTGTLSPTRGGTGANLSATGGTGQYVKQVTVGGGFTVGAVPASDIASGAALTKVDDTNVTLTLGGTPTTALLAATSVTVNWSGTLSLARGGTAANLTASLGGIFYSTASAGAVLSGTATARQMLQSGASAAPAWSTTTWPATTTINRILYSSAANVISDLATANSSILVTDSGGIPSLSTTLPAHTLGGTVSGGGNQINNVIIGTTTPLAVHGTTIDATGGFSSTVGPTTAWSLDNSGLNFNVSASSNTAAFQAGSGLVVVSENTVLGETAIFLCGGGAATLVAQTGTSFSVTTTPAAGKYGFAFSTGYKIFNGSGGSINFSVASLKSRASS